MIYGPAASDGGNTNNLLIVPGDIHHSIIWNRIAASNGFTRMPPLATTQLDPQSIQLIADWITQDLPSRQSFAQWQIQHFGSTNHPDAGPGQDPDQDGATNYEEFLAYTNPNDPFDVWTGHITAQDGTAYVGYDLPNRFVTVEYSTNLIQQSWRYLAVDGNQALPLAPGLMRLLPVPETLPEAHFRFQIEEP